MSRAVHTARVRVYQDERPYRRAYIADFPEPVRYGVHAGIAEFYGVKPKEEVAATLDHVVATAAG